MQQYRASSILPCIHNQFSCRVTIAIHPEPHTLPSCPSLIESKAGECFFYANDHLPKHVHVIIKGENRGAKIWLHDISLAKNSMLRQHELKIALGIVKQNQQAYKEAWDEFFSN